MTPLPPVSGVNRIEFRVGDNASIDAGSRFFFSYSSAPPSAAQQAATAAGIAAAWATNMAPLTQSTESLHNITVTDLSSDTGAIGTWTGSETGSRSGGVLPASAAAVVNHTIARHYRGGKPRTYLRCGTATDLSGTNEWLAASITDFVSGWQSFINAIQQISGASLVNIVNVSYFSGGSWVTNPSGRPVWVPTKRATPLVDSITGATVATKLGSQRRRLNI